MSSDRLRVWKSSAGEAIFKGMDSETRAAFTALNGTVAALGEKLTTLDQKVTTLDGKVTSGFARTDRFFELGHAQLVELHAEVRELSERVDALTARVSRLEQEVAQFRDFVTGEIAKIRTELRELYGHPAQTDELRREIAELALRVDRLERRQQGN